MVKRLLESIDAERWPFALGPRRSKGSIVVPVFVGAEVEDEIGIINTRLESGGGMGVTVAKDPCR